MAGTSAGAKKGWASRRRGVARTALGSTKSTPRILKTRLGGITQYLVKGGHSKTHMNVFFSKREAKSHVASVNRRIRLVHGKIRKRR